MEIPLFPLHTVLAPGLAIPLHVFEERYRVMVRRCLDTSTPFGVVLIREGSEIAPPAGESRELAIACVGTFAEIREASRTVDGRWDLLAVGAGRFVVREVHAGREPYLVAEVEPVDDSPGEPDVADELVRRVTRRFVDYLRLLQPREGETAEPLDIQVEVEVPEGPGAGEAAAPGAAPQDIAAALRIPDDPSTLSFLLTGILQVEPHRKQALLEATSAEERLRGLDDLLDRELAFLRLRLGPFTSDPRTVADRAN